MPLVLKNILSTQLHFKLQATNRISSLVEIPKPFNNLIACRFVTIDIFSLISS